MAARQEFREIQRKLDAIMDHLGIEYEPEGKQRFQVQFDSHTEESPEQFDEALLKDAAEVAA